LKKNIYLNIRITTFIAGEFIREAGLEMVWIQSVFNR